MRTWHLFLRPVPPILYVRFMQPPRAWLESEFGGIQWRLTKRFPTMMDNFKDGHDEAWVAQPVPKEWQ